MNSPQTEVPIVKTSWKLGLVKWATLEHGGSGEFGEKIHKELSYGI